MKRQTASLRIVTPAGNYWGMGRINDSKFVAIPTDSMDEGLYDAPIEVEFHGSFVVEYLDPKKIIKCREG